MPPFNTVPGLVPLKIYSGSTLLTTNVNLINFTGSGVTTTVNAFNGLTVTIGGGGTTVDTGSLLKTASFSNPNLTFTKGDGSTFDVDLITLVPTSASYALTSSFAISASYAPVTPPFPYTGSAQITGSLGVTGSVSMSFSTGEKVYIAGAVGSAETLLEIRRLNSNSGGFIFRSNSSLSQQLETTNGIFNINTVDNSDIQLWPGTGSVNINTTVLNMNAINSGVQFKIGTQAASLLNRWINVGTSTDSSYSIIQAAQNGATPAANNIRLNPFGGYVGIGSATTGSNLIVFNGLISASYSSSNLSVGGTPGWTTPLRNTAIGVSTQGSVTTQTDNTSVGYLTLLGGTYNTAVGSYAAQLNTGDGNVALGYYALGNQTSNISYNIAIGWQSMFNASGSGTLHNISLGYQSMYSARGTYNIAMGYRSGFGLTTGYQNIFLGYRAGLYTSISGDNIAIGHQAGLKISSSDNSNILIGTSAGGNDSGGATLMGSGNVGIGLESLAAISSSAGASPGNVAIGFQSGRGLTTGTRNILLGYRAGWGIGRGSSNIFMGSDVGLATTTQAISNNISIGSSTLNVNVSASYNVAVGTSALTSVGATASGANNGSWNIALGYNAGSILKTGMYNVFIGVEAGANNSGNPVSNGSYTTFIGHRAGMIQGNNGDWGNYSVGIGTFAMGYNGGITPIAPGVGNTAVGSSTLTRISSSITTRNTAVGYNAGVVLNVGANNTFVGSYSGQNFATGSSNIFVGDSAGNGIVSGSRNTIIGSITGLTASLNDTIIIGAGSTERIRIDASGSMGLGTTAPSSSAKLQIDSTIQGFLPPRMTNAQRTAITAPAIGLIVYCTDATEGLYVNKSTGWTFII